MSTWPHIDIPGAGLLDEHELHDACARKRVIRLSDEQMRAVDETGGGCGTCGGDCASPQACEMAEPANLSGFPLEPYLTRHVWLGPLLLALVGFVWLCMDGYLENLPQ